MDWSSFAARRRLNVMAWCAHNRFATYGDVKKWCKEHDVQAPDRAVVSPYLSGRKGALYNPKSKQEVAESAQNLDTPQAASTTPDKTTQAAKKKRSKKKPSSIVG